MLVRKQSANGKMVNVFLKLRCCLSLLKELGCSIDALLTLKELLVLSAVYSDGLTHLDVKQMLNNLVNANQLNIIVNSQFLGISIKSTRLKVLTVKFQNPGGVYYSFAVQDKLLVLDVTTKAYEEYISFKIIGAYYGGANCRKGRRIFRKNNIMELNQVFIYY